MEPNLRGPGTVATESLEARERTDGVGAGSGIGRGEVTAAGGGYARETGGVDLRAAAGGPLAAVAAVLRRVWGFDELRPLQAEAIAASLAGRDSLVVLPTGGGKSLCYQAP